MGKVRKRSGTIYLNGEVCDSLAAWKASIGFVPQEDIMHRRLTVLDNVLFAAMIRLPDSLSYDEKMQKVWINQKKIMSRYL